MNLTMSVMKRWGRKPHVSDFQDQRVTRITVSIYEVYVIYEFLLFL